MRDQFSRTLWDTIDIKEKESLLKAEAVFVRVRRLGQLDRAKEPFDTMILSWSRVAERFLRRFLSSVDVQDGSGKPLGHLIGMAKNVIERGSDSRSPEEKNRLQSVPAALNELNKLNLVNKKGVKHLDGIDLT